MWSKKLSFKRLSCRAKLHPSLKSLSDLHITVLVLLDLLPKHVCVSYIDWLSLDEPSRIRQDGGDGFRSDFGIRRSQKCNKQEAPIFFGCCRNAKIRCHLVPIRCQQSVNMSEGGKRISSVSLICHSSTVAKRITGEPLSLEFQCSFYFW